MKNFKGLYICFTVVILTTVTLFFGCASTLTPEERWARKDRGVGRSFVNREKNGLKIEDFIVNGKEITIKFITLNISSDQIDPVKFAEKFKTFVPVRACKNLKLRDLLNNDVVFIIQFFSNDKMLIYETRMDKIWCK